MRPLLVTLIVAVAVAVTGCGGDAGRLELTIRDTESGAPVPARVELLDERGVAMVPGDALAIFDDCGRLPLHNWLPFVPPWQWRLGAKRAIEDPYAGTTQFYSAGHNRVALAPGRYRIAVTKGLERRRARAEATVRAGRTARVEIALERWADLPAEGWYGADDHLHIPRPFARFDEAIATWMQAEDLHVANLLQMGLASDLHITPQRDFGPRSVYRRGDTLVVSGQENPRTHVLGHAIVLGAERWIDFPDSYLRYDRFWRAAHEHGGVNGYAHWGLGGAEEGMAVWGHEGLLDFVEVLGFGLPYYRRWYQALELGYRLGPTAGTDYPCSPSLPGRERFYARLDGPLTHAAWLEAVRAGRTFVTNGPLIDLRVDGARIGGEVTLTAPGPVRVEATVRFDPERERVTVLELVQGGEVVARAEAMPGAAAIRLDTALAVERSTWLAARARGEKRGETELDLRVLVAGMMVLERASSDAVLAELPPGPAARPSAAHTGAIWIDVAGTPALGTQARARQTAQMWLARLDELERRFDDERLSAMAGFPGRGDGVAEDDLRAGRAALLAAIEAARRHYSALAAGVDVEDRATVER